MDAGALLDLLGNENRRRILRLLSRKPCYVTEISEHLGVSPKAVIDHLRRLEEAGLVESRTDEQRRKYFHIAQHLRLEVTLAPYAFGMKSAYPASPSLDLSSCQHLSLEVSRERRVRLAADGHPDAAGVSRDATDARRDASDGGGARRGDARGPGGTEVAVSEIASLAEELDELEAVERELSLAQRWVQGRMADVLDRLSGAVDDEGYVDAEILATVAGGTGTVESISREVDVPPAAVEDCLARLADRGLVRRDGDAWVLAR